MTPRERDSIERIAYRPAEAAEALGVCVRTIYNLLESGQLPSFTIGQARRIRVSDVRAVAGEKEPATRHEALPVRVEELPVRVRELPAGVVEREATEQAAYVLMFGKRWRCELRGDDLTCKRDTYWQD